MKIIENENAKIGVYDAQDVAISNAQALLDSISDSVYEGCTDFIFRKEHFPDEFYDLKTGLAGEILQKMTNYRLRLAIVGDFTSVNSNSLRAFIAESNRGNQNFFVATEGEAIKKLSRRAD